jgi:hypothetical protein
MKVIETTGIVDPLKQQPFSGRSLDFLQNNVRDLGTWMYSALVGSTYTTSGTYIGGSIWGANRVGNIIGDGIVLDFFSGELRRFTGADVTSYSNPPRVIEDNSYDLTIDPITYSDLSTGNVHLERKWKIADVASGGFLYSQLLILNEEWQPATLLNSFTGSLFYKRDLRSNSLYIRGTVNRATTNPVNTTIFTLPAAYRPETTQNNVVMYTSDNGTIINELNTSSSTGEVQIVLTGGLNSIVININTVLRLD